ncbi:hypothetical protein [Gilvimarinus sp. DA14]|uniref:hypothetical protein n=1 Tax=Gilvimarinus sp. DA14 TaxID=2956798 RepID=UPI0020B87EBA|nr:hypothetical protein [Gilvimarinus sp. DA14]UTF60126.1 hypothetical protein NHM04_16885 [Gilvimarinus sp. DA14]
MLRPLLILCTLAANFAYAEDVFTYRIAPECIVDIEIVENANIYPPEKRKYQINIRLEDSEGEKFEKFTREIIGSKLEITNGFGESLNFPSSKVVTEIGSTFRLSPYATLLKSEEAVKILKVKGGRCGRDRSS